MNEATFNPRTGRDVTIQSSLACGLFFFFRNEIWVEVEVEVRDDAWRSEVKIIASGVWLCCTLTPVTLRWTVVLIASRRENFTRRGLIGAGMFARKWNENKSDSTPPLLLLLPNLFHAVKIGSCIQILYGGSPSTRDGFFP